jgi:hypothetical protein
VHDVQVFTGDNPRTRNGLWRPSHAWHGIRWVVALPEASSVRYTGGVSGISTAGIMRWSKQEHHSAFEGDSG